MNQEANERYEIPVSRFRRSSLELPSEFLARFEDRDGEISLIAHDAQGQRYALYIDLYEGTLCGSDLRKWYGRHVMGPDQTILLEVMDDSERFRLATREGGDEVGHGLLLGRRWSMVGALKDQPGNEYRLDPERLLTHVFICGATGSGKTVLAKALLEEALLSGIPCVAIDLKGDITSMALWLDQDDAGIIQDWVRGNTSGQRSREAENVLRKHWGNHSDTSTKTEALRMARRLRSSVETTVYTPRTSRGVQLSFPAALAAPSDVRSLGQTGELDELVRTQTEAFLDRLYPGTKRQRIENERVFVFELVKWAWVAGEDLRGREGVKRLLRLIQEPPFEKIGALPVSEYIDAENRRARLINKVNGLITGPDAVWFEGTPLTMDLLLTPGDEDAQLPLSVINLADIIEFEDRSFVVAQIANTIRNWMRTQSGSSFPRLLLFIDEIGGGGGKQALFASHPYECAAKWGLNYLVRQGRSFGVCVMLATQNPGDVDYRALSNCETHIIGRLGTRRDRSKALESVSVTDMERQRLESFITKAQAGDFAVLSGGERQIDFIRSRWIHSYHMSISPADLPRIARHSQADA